MNQKEEAPARARKGKKSVRRSIILMNLIIVLIVAFAIGIVAFAGLMVMKNAAVSTYDNAKTEGYKAEIKSEIETAISVCQTYYDAAQDGKMTQSEAQDAAKETVRGMRYREDQSGYFWIDDTDYNLVMHPILTDQEGTNRHDLEDQEGNMIIQMIYKSCTSSAGGGFNEFWFTKADGVTVAPKLAYSEIFEPWGWMISTGNYTDDMQAEMASTEKSLRNTTVRTVISLYIILAICLVFSIFFSNRMGKKFTAPLKKIQKLADRLSAGNLTESVEVKDQNEFGETGTDLNNAQKNIGDMIRGISRENASLEQSISTFSDNFESMTEAISNVSKAMNDIAENNTEQAKSTSDAAESIEALSGYIDESSGNAARLDQNAGDMMEYSNQSMKTLEDLIRKGEETIEDVNSMSAQTKETNDSVAQISEAADLIGQIASQTNLLSLNASIEAARAGEQGRGFAVVAEEIGQLASQSDESAKSISQIIAALVDNSKKQTETMERMQAVSKEQLDAFHSTKETFDKLKASLDECFESVSAISASMKTMTAEKEKIQSNIEALNDAAANNAASTEETSSMASELEETISKSKGLVDVLRKDLAELTETMKRFTV